MSESKEHFYRDFSKFDEMSTEELNEILRQDSQLPDGEDSDTDAILYIMGVIAKRNQELPSSDFGDVIVLLQAKDARSLILMMSHS